VPLISLLCLLIKECRSFREVFLIHDIYYNGQTPILFSIRLSRNRFSRAHPGAAKNSGI